MSTISDDVMKYTNLALGIAHAGQAVQMLTMFLVRNADYTTNATIESGPDELNTYPLPAVALVAPIPSAIAHFVQYGEFGKYIDMVDKGYNPIRWIDYSISNPLIYWVLAQMSVVRDVSTLFGTGLAVAGSQLIAGHVERTEETTMGTVAMWVSFMAGFTVIFGHWVEYFDVLDDFKWITFVMLVLFLTYIILVTVKKYNGGDGRTFEMIYMVLTAVTRTLFIQYLAWGEWFDDANWIAP